MPEISVEQFKEWIEILGKPTGAVLAFIILILYREVVIHWLKMFADVIGSWLKRR